MRVLVRTPNWIGDQVLAYPFFKNLRNWVDRQAAPGQRGEIHAVCVPWVQALQYRDLVDHVHVMPRGATSVGARFLQALQLPGLGRELARATGRRAGAFDLAISLPNSWSAAWHLLGTRAKRRRGYATEGRSLFLTDALPWDPDPKRHRSQAYLDLLPHDPGATLLSPAACVAAFDPAKSWPKTSRPVDSGIRPPTDEPFWIIAPGATAPARQWPWEKFAHMALKAHQELGWSVVLVGGPKEVGIAESFLQWCVSRGIPVTSLVDRLPVTHLEEWFRKCKLTLCNESGLAHVAALCGSAVHIACGAADPRRTAPLGPGRVTVSTHPVPCWPCEENHCPNSGTMHLACLKGLEWERVWSELRSHHA